MDIREVGWSSSRSTASEGSKSEDAMLTRLESAVSSSVDPLSPRLFLPLVLGGISLHYSHAVVGFFHLILKSFKGRLLPSQENVAVVGQPAHTPKVT